MASTGLLEPGLEPQGYASSRHRVSKDLADIWWIPPPGPFPFAPQEVTYFLEPSGPQSPQPGPAASPVPQLCVLCSISLPSTQILVALPGSEPGRSCVRCFDHTLCTTMVWWLLCVEQKNMN